MRDKFVEDVPTIIMTARDGKEYQLPNSGTEMSFVVGATGTPEQLDALGKLWQHYWRLGYEVTINMKWPTGR